MAERAALLPVSAVRAAAALGAAALAAAALGANWPAATSEGIELDRIILLHGLLPRMTSDTRRPQP